MMVLYDGFTAIHIKLGTGFLSESSVNIKIHLEKIPTKGCTPD